MLYMIHFVLFLLFYWIIAWIIARQLVNEIIVYIDDKLSHIIYIVMYTYPYT